LPQGAAGHYELVGPGVAIAVAACVPKSLVVALDAAGDDVDVESAAGDLVQRGGHLSEQACRDEAGADGDQEAYSAGDGSKGCHRGPRLRQWRALVEEAVGEPRGYQQRVEAQLLRRIHHPSKVLECRRPLGPMRAYMSAVPVDGDEPVEEGLRPLGEVAHVEYLGEGRQAEAKLAQAR
jgi:hypothetical protein